MTKALPEFLQYIADLVGREAALKLAEACGGGDRVYIPAPEALKEGHWLVKIIGMEAAMIVAKDFAVLSPKGRISGGRVLIPLGPLSARDKLHQQILEAAASGLSNETIARKFKVDVTTVRRIRRRRRLRLQRQRKAR